MKKLLVLLLALTLLLTGCGLFRDWSGYTAYADMEYTRPDLFVVEKTLNAACAAAENAKTLQELENRILEFYDIYDSCYTNYNLAYMKYCTDVTDIYWQDEYAFCAANIAKLNAGLDTLYRALAKSPYREKLEGDDYFGADYFDAYEGESQWDETFLSYLEEEAALEEHYYSLCEASYAVAYYSEDFFTQYAPDMAQVFLELVQLRQEMAAYLGYSSYPEFAYDFYYYRDYTPAEATAYFETIGKQMVSLYRRMETVDGSAYCSEQETLSYVAQAAYAMGGSIFEAYGMLQDRGLHDIAPGENKYDISFEVYLDSYYEPFIFMYPYENQYDKLTFAHEFGHFVNDFVCGGSYAGTDVAEVHSQGMEYLSLCYTEDSQALKELKLADCLSIYVEQSAYSLFEHKVYALTGDELTLENIQDLYTQIGMDFGFESRDWDYRDYVLITHLFIEPLYMASYVASNDVAFQIYQKEIASPGAGLEIYEKILSSQDTYLVAFAAEHGLENPFDPERVLQVCKALDPMLH